MASSHRVADGGGERSLGRPPSRGMSLRAIHVTPDVPRVTAGFVRMPGEPLTDDAAMDALPSPYAEHRPDSREGLLQRRGSRRVSPAPARARKGDAYRQHADEGRAGELSAGEYGSDVDGGSGDGASPSRAGRNTTTLSPMGGDTREHTRQRLAGAHSPDGKAGSDAKVPSSPSARTPTFEGLEHAKRGGWKAAQARARASADTKATPREDPVSPAASDKQALAVAQFMAGAQGAGAGGGDERPRLAKLLRPGSSRKILRVSAKMASDSFFSWRVRLYRVLVVGRAVDTAEMLIRNFMIFIIFVDVLSVMTETVVWSDFREDVKLTTVEAMEWGTTAIFILEYCLRLWCCVAARDFPRYGAERGYRLKFLQGRLRFMLTKRALFDLLVLLPLPASLMMPDLDMYSPDNSNSVVNTLRIVRSLRLVKFAGYSPQMQALFSVMYGKRHELLTSLLICGALVMLLSVFVFIAEAKVNAAYENLIVSLWWGVVTLTTVGCASRAARCTPPAGAALCAAAVLSDPHRRCAYVCLCAGRRGHRPHNEHGARAGVGGRRAGHRSLHHARRHHRAGLPRAARGGVQEEPQGGGARHGHHQAGASAARLLRAGAAHDPRPRGGDEAGRGGAAGAPQAGLGGIRAVGCASNTECGADQRGEEPDVRLPQQRADGHRRPARGAGARGRRHERRLPRLKEAAERHTRTYISPISNGSQSRLVTQ